MESGDIKRIQHNKLPSFGWHVKLDHDFPDKRSQFYWPKFTQIIHLIPLIIRYVIYTVKCWVSGVEPVMDYVKTPACKEMYGAPIGGIGSGTIGRGFKGEFCRFHLIPGLYKYHTVNANQFIVTVRNMEGRTVYQQVLSTQKKPQRDLSAWKWEFPSSNGHYTALYPRSWMQYNIPECNIKLTCRQISPVIPHNYKDSSIPGAAFIWNVENEGHELLDVSISFTFKNGLGGEEDLAGGAWTEVFTESNVSGVKIHHTLNGMPCTYAIGAKQQGTNSVSYKAFFDPCSNGHEIWEDLLEDGELDSGKRTSSKTSQREEVAAAVCIKMRVENNSTSTAEMALAWDMPKVYFHNHGREYKRFYTKYFGATGDAGSVLCKYILDEYQNWENLIEQWQAPVLEDEELPDWYKSALFNETYYVADGGSIWVLPDESETLLPDDPRMEYGHFAYLEGHEYRMYNTYDVHYYASFALAKLWPHLQEVLQYDFMDAIGKVDKTPRWQLYNGSVTYRKVINSVPHDLGDPYEEPFLKINSYPVHDVSEWKDLNLKFVLQCYRDWKVFANKKYIQDMWPKIHTVMQIARQWDTDGDGLIENGGTPDQTYDSWVMTGPSSYCGSLWLGALLCTQKIASELGQDEIALDYHNLLQKARLAFEEKLWNGEYYNFDCAPHSGSSTIMADQLCGLWYLRASSVRDQVFIETRVKSALKKVFDFNVMKFKSGLMGAVNGMTPSGEVDCVTIQSLEVWTGVVYGLAALMIHEGMIPEAFRTAQGIYNTVYYKTGLGFQTPEALYAEKCYRAFAYMRPLSIWAIQHAWEMHKREI